MQLYNLLPIGETNRVTSAELQGLTGLSYRQLRREIRKLRLDGLPICSTCCPPGGYWRAENETELATFLRSMDRRGKSVFKAAQSARQTLKDLQREVEA